MFAQLVYSKKSLSQVAQVVLREIQDFFFWHILKHWQNQRISSQEPRLPFAPVPDESHCPSLGHSFNYFEISLFSLTNAKCNPYHVFISPLR